MQKLLLLFLAGGLLFGQNPVIRSANPRGPTAGQVLISNGPGADPSMQDPIVSFNYVTLFTTQSATGTATSSAVRIPTLSAYGTLSITGSGITGSPSGCQIALDLQQSTGAPASSAIATQTFTPGNSYQSFSIAPSAGSASGDTLIGVYTCGTYPTAGTISVSFDSVLPVQLLNSTVAVTQSGTWTVITTPPANASTNVAQVAGTTTDTNSGNKSAGTQRIVIATDQPALTNALKVDGSAVTQPVSQKAATSTSGTLQSSAVANGNGTNLSVDGMSAVMLTVNCSSCSGGTQVNFEGSEDNANFTSVNAVQLGTSTIASSTTASGVTVWELPVAGFQVVRARISAYSAGTITITGHADPVPYNPKVVNTNLVSAIPTGANTIGAVTQASGPWTTNQTQIGGTAVDTNSGNKSAGTQRFVLATDQPALTNALKVDGSAATQPVSAVSLPLPTGVGTLLSGQQAVTATAVALATNGAKGICVKALAANSINVYVGPSGVTTSTGMELAANQSVCAAVNNTNLIFVIASTTGASVSWAAIN